MTSSKQTVPRARPLTALQIKLIVLGIVVLIALCPLLWRWKLSTPDSVFSTKISESVGYVAAEEAAQILGDTYGGVALILPPTGPGPFEKSLAGDFERGFKMAAAKLPSLAFFGHYLAEPETPVTLDTWLAAREKFPEARLLVSFIGLPQLADRDEQRWKAIVPPRMIAVESSLPEAVANHRLVKLGLVDAIYVRQNKPFPKHKPTQPRETFALSYDVIRPPAR